MLTMGIDIGSRSSKVRHPRRRGVADLRSIETGPNIVKTAQAVVGGGRQAQHRHLGEYG